MISSVVSAIIRTRLNPRKLVSLAVTISFIFLAVMSSQAQTHWVGTWATSQQLVEPQNSIPAADLPDMTLRQIVRVSIGGSQIRVRLSNRYGTAPLHLTSVHIAKPLSTKASTIDPTTDKALTFSGQPDVTIPAGADYLSDSFAYPLAPFADVAITLHTDASPPPDQNGHPGSRTTSYFVKGNQVSATELANAKTNEHWYYIAGIDVVAPAPARSVAVLGDSITDGRGSTTNENNRWTDFLAHRLQTSPDTKAIGVLNHGIGGNRVLLDHIGPNAMARFDHDIVTQAGVRYLIVFEGINDIGTISRGEMPQSEHDAFVQRIITAYEQMIARAHTSGIKVMGATILPFGGCFYDKPAAQADWKKINEWILTPGHFDGVVDLAKATADPAKPDHLLPAFDSGDHLHPSPAGFDAMANAVPLAFFSEKPPQPGQIAFTFDDLPAHSALPSNTSRTEIAQKLIAAFRAEHMPPIYGMVNGALIEKVPGDAEVLKIWHDAGNPLGNHTWSHPHLSQSSVEDFEKEITRNEPVISSVMKKGDWHWFRYPFLDEGDTPEKRDAIRAFLASHKYKVASVTMSFGDYMWNEPYARCVAKNDQQAIATLKSSYLAAADESITRYRSMSQQLYGRDIPYVLLMHIGALDAEMMPELLKLYRDRGFTFVTLPEAESDEFYHVDTDLHQPIRPESLEQAFKDRGLPIPPRGITLPQFDTMCR